MALILRDMCWVSSWWKVPAVGLGAARPPGMATFAVMESGLSSAVHVPSLMGGKEWLPLGEGNPRLAAKAGSP